MQENDTDCSRVAQHVLVLGSGCYVKPNSTVPAQSAGSTLPSASTQESDKPKSPCLAPRASTIKEAQQNQSMKQSRPFLQNSARVIRWTSGHHQSNP